MASMCVTTVNAQRAGEPRVPCGEIMVERTMYKRVCALFVKTEKYMRAAPGSW